MSTGARRADSRRGRIARDRLTSVPFEDRVSTGMPSLRSGTARLLEGAGRQTPRAAAVRLKEPCP